MNDTARPSGRLLELLDALVATPGVSGDESRVAALVRRTLIEGGYSETQLGSDYLGNQWLALGPAEAPQRMLVAHMDEIGFRVASIRADGLATLTSIGGNDPQLWEGSPVIVHSAGGPIHGCIAPVSHHVTLRQGFGPDKRIALHEMYLDIGARSREEAEALGLHLLDPLTWPKQLIELPNNLVQGRSLDDRFGCAVLLELALRLHARQPSVPTLLVWAVQEEVGLRGARALAARFTSLQEVIAVDSFTVGAGPRDNRQFDSARLGGGAVLRSLDSTTIVPDVLRRALLDKAAALGFSLQYGFMPGGNDASEFERLGARCFGAAVALQYSHTQVERIHMGDLAELTDFLDAWTLSSLAL